ncbi:MAG: putative glycolipid-binding domain-containing protein [Candidatus Rokubacteria bacterium]|nr:putative glycolipid-binding domain-containing protein [Candidatus Rokubacteria bacterium]
MKRDVMWARESGPGLEHLRLVQDSAGIAADGVILGVEDDVPFRARYEIRCDARWRVREVSLGLLGGRGQGLTLRADGEGRWRAESGDAVPQLDGCIDVDISVTPFTNTLPIRRLALRPGEAAEITVAYLSVPELELKPAKQRYTCLHLDRDGGVYRYEGLLSGFTAELQVDADGLVVEYPGIFRRVWPQ